MNTLNYHHLYYFWTVCQEGGFTKASQKLHISQSAVSEQVSRLEENLGQKLIERTTRSLVLTENGNVALKYADMIFGAGRELVDFMLHRPKQGKQSIRIGALSSLSRNLQARFLNPILDRKEVRFSLIVGDLKRLIRLLKDHQVDVILTTHSGMGNDTGELYTHLLMQSPLCIVSRTKKRHTNLKSIFENEVVFLPSVNLESRSEFDHFVETHDLNIELAGEVDDIALLRLLALTGKGIVIIPRMGAINEIESKKLFVIHEFKEIYQKYYAITRQKKFPNTLVAELVKSLQEQNNTKPK